MGAGINAAHFVVSGFLSCPPLLASVSDPFGSLIESARGG
ncbi:hypothetical protein NNJEOMEG_00649 [Fundidesulfovibrio magnetotacticus]|uniref:Uncharacterized protein n=1 Tax=Fundidesulfovibrio magnetotacticus TaxID=2730080 RepID=A0A6V8LJA5_9BACT|nr:hypothetical protein NNJEOMEG_00649 [Fundidesulfovibrio magnetotacticus]